jgi:hypothetical protein
MSAPTVTARSMTPKTVGWIEAGVFSLLIAILSVAYTMAAVRGVHIAVFILYSLLISAATLLAFTGFGQNARAIMFARESWIVGFSNIIVEGGYASLLGYVTPAEGSLLIRLSIPVTILIGFIAYGRRPSLLAWAGAGLVGAVVAIMLSKVAAGIAIPVIGSAFACALAVAIRAFASEFHKWNRVAITIPDKIRVTALVTLVTAVTGLATIGALMTAVYLGWLPQTPLLPQPEAMLHGPTILFALFVGGALFTGMTYLSFSSVLKIKSENFIATSAFMPVVTLLVQIPAAAVGLISLPPFDWHLLPAMLAAIIGVLMIIWGNRHA